MEKLVTLAIQCLVCHNIHLIKVYENDLKDFYEGMHVEEAFPYLDAGDRELLISMICGKCFDKLWDEAEDI